METEDTQEKIFTCRMCGYCCHGETTVSLSPEDQQRMLDHLQISRTEALERYWRRRGSVVQMQTLNGHCIFYDDGCSIHEARPFRCREWPLVQAILHDATTLDTLRKSCPGLSKNVSYAGVCAELGKCSCLRKAEGHGT